MDSSIADKLGEGSVPKLISPGLLRKILRRYRRLSRRVRRIFILSTLIVVALFCLIAFVESKTSLIQSWYLSKLALELNFGLEAGKSQNTLYPEFGPYDIRLGYTQIPRITEIMEQRGFRVAAQAVMSPRMLELTRHGVFPTYESKVQAGLVLNDRNNNMMFSVLRPQRLYEDFDSIPKMVLNALLFIENKEVLDDVFPYKNPAIEWDRFFRATLENIYEMIQPGHSAPGGSTIATQLEKYRHSPEGRTHSIEDKLRQMFSASLRSYEQGRDTQQTRRQIVHTYVNSIPLAAFPGFGEVNGVGDGLWTWYATDFDSCNQILMRFEEGQTPLSEEGALCYRKILSLFVAHRRPSYYLLKGRQELGELVNSYLRLMARSGSLPLHLADAALNAKVFFRGGTMESPPTSFVDHKAVNAVRTGLSALLGVPKLYDLDQMDLLVRSSIDKSAHDEVTRTLQRLNDPLYAKELGLNQSRLLAKGDPAKVTYSLTLFERTPRANLLRIQTDNFDGPFDINSGTRLDLGSTAKLRTLVTYLEIVQQLYEHLSTLSQSDRNKQRPSKFDPITAWAIDELNANPKATLLDFLAASMQRSYSANPGESFFTGGGLHFFGNFKKEDNGRVVPISVALRESINLPFVRLMRDVVRFYSAHPLTQNGRAQVDISAREEEAQRQNYLQKFADREGSDFMRSFYNEYRGLKSGEFSERFFSKLKPISARFATAYRYIFPTHSSDQFYLALHKRFETIERTESDLLFENYTPGKFDLNDSGYLVRLHPLELWMVRYLEENPEAALKQILEKSKDERQIVYKWLFRPSKRRAQDVRIKRLIEEDAFASVYRSWKATGYPFASMVPSLASAIGSSGDRPSALAELMGVILNDGIRLPRGGIEQLHFASGTPYETIFERDTKAQGERIFSPEVAQTLRAALIDVVQNGTARRLKDQIKLPDGTALEVGGKTGTGDHQFKQFGPGGVVISSRVISRTATFVFFIGDRFFGTVTAHVRGPEAANYEFTSALAAEVLKASAPSLKELLASPRQGSEH